MDEFKTEILQGNSTFEPDLGTIDKGYEYQAKCVAFIALKTLQTGDSFWLSSNMTEMSPLDDIIMCTKHNGLNTLYLFQITHKLNPKVIEDNEFTKDKTKFSIPYFHKKFSSNIKQSIDSKIPQTFKPIGEYKFIIFTNRPVHKNILEERSDGIFNTKGGQCYSFLHKSFHKKTGDFYKFLDITRIYASQKNVSEIEEEIRNCIEVIEKIEVTMEVSNTYLSYIQNWIQIQVAKLGLNDVLVNRLLVFSLLQSFSLPLSTQTIKKVESTNLLWRCIKNQCLSVSQEFKEYVNANILEDIKKNKCTGNSDFDFFGNILFKPFNLKKWTVEQKYLLLCLCGKLPLVLITENRTYLGSIKHFKYILMETNAYTKNLLEIDDDALLQLKGLQITLNCRRNISLGEIIGDSRQILGELSVSDVLKLVDNCHNSSDKENDIVIERNTNKVILNHNVLKIPLTDLFVFIDSNIDKERLISVFKLNEVGMCFANTYNEKCKYVLLKESDNLEKFRNLKTRNVHFIKTYSIFKDNKIAWEIEWKGTYGNVENIKAFRRFSSSAVKLEDFNNYFKQSFLIVSGVPGIGKSIYLKQIALNIPANQYVLIVNLTQEESYFKRLDISNATVDDFLNQFCRETDPILLQIFKMKVASKQIKILFDGFDEIAPTFTTIVSEVITRIRSEDYKIILTTRTVLQEYVENIFGTFSIFLQPFSEADQKYYLELYFKNYFDKQSEYYASMLLDLIKSNKIGDSEFYSVPLNLKLIAEVLVRKWENQKVPPSSLYINRLQLYEKYTSDKITIYSEKIKMLNIDNEEIERYHKLFAVNTLFKHLNDYGRISTDLSSILNGYISRVKRGAEKTGLLISDVEEVFIHKTIAEYFGAKWIWDVINNNGEECFTGEREFAKSILKNHLLRKEFDTLRLFFDLITSKNCHLHEAILAENYKYIMDVLHFNSKEITVLDKHNRTILHSLISNCQISNKTNQLNSDLIKILNLLFKNYKNILTQEDMSGLTPLDYANARVETQSLQIFVNQIDHQSQFYVYYNEMFNIIEFLFPEQINIKIPELLEILPNVQNKFCTRIHDAAKYGHLNVIEGFLIGGTDINVRDENGNHMIHNAAESGHLGIIDFLLCKGVAIVTENNDGATSLHCAASNANTEVIEYLLTKNSYIDKSDSNGFSPIFYSVEHNYLESLKFLLSKNADLKKKDRDGNSILHHAAKFGHQDIVRYLLQKGLELEYKNNSKATAVHIAAKNGHLDILKFFISENASINQTGNKNATLMHYAADNGHLHIIEFLYERGFELSVGNEFGSTPLHHAARHGHLHLVQYFWENGIDVDYTTENQVTALHNAARTGQKHIIQFLLEKGAEIDLKDKYGTTAMHNAARNRHLDLIILLIENGAGINVRNNYGTTPLHIAVQSGYSELVEYLISKGADPNCQTNDKILPLHYAAEIGIIKIIKLLLDHSHINAQDEDGYTPLHYAIGQGRCSAITYLINQQADVNLLTNSDRQILFGLESYGNESIFN